MQYMCDIWNDQVNYELSFFITLLLIYRNDLFFTISLDHNPKIVCVNFELWVHTQITYKNYWLYLVSLYQGKQFWFTNFILYHELIENFPWQERWGALIHSQTSILCEGFQSSQRKTIPIIKSASCTKYCGRQECIECWPVCNYCILSQQLHWYPLFLWFASSSKLL